jgi:hypothetical protein
MSKKSSKQAGKNGAYIEQLVLGRSSNPENLTDDNEIEVKSCQDYYFYYHHSKIKKEKRAGNFKINIEQHKYLLEINGFYLFIVHNLFENRITFAKVISAKNIEIMFNFVERPVTKHHCFNINWRKLQ